MVVGSNALRSGPFVAFNFFFFFFGDTAETDRVVVLVIPWHDKVNDWTLTDRALGDQYRPQTDAECGFRSGWSFWPVRSTARVFSQGRHLDAQEQNTNFVTRLSRQAHDREICLNPAVAILRCTSHCGETARFLPPFFGGTQHPLLKFRLWSQRLHFEVPMTIG